MTTYDEFDPAARAAALLAEAEHHISGQHVVSRVVLKFFEGPHGDSEKIGVYSVKYGPQRPIGRARAGLAPDLLRVGSTSAEKLWQRTENRLDAAIEDARACGGDASPRSLHTLRKAMALHFARNKVTVEIFDGLWSERGPALVAKIIDRHRLLLTLHFVQRMGHQPSQPELVDLVNEYTSDGTQLNTTGAWTRARVEQLFLDLMSDERTRRRMEIVRPVEGSEFLIGDNPVSTYLALRGEVSTPRRIGWDVADEIVMPFATDLAVCMVRDDVRRATPAMHVAESVAAEARVVQLNLRQVRCARDYVFHRPAAH